MNRICLVVLIGLPAAGKTSLCKYLLEMNTLPFNILHLCYDNYVEFKVDNSIQYKEQRDRLEKSLTTIIKKFAESGQLTSQLINSKSHYKNDQHKDLIILCDDNHYYRSMRYKIFQVARGYETGYCQIFLECNVQLAFDRNSLRSKETKVPNDVIVKMSNRLEAPNILANKWEENTLFLQNPNFDMIIENVIDFIKQFLNKPVQPLQLPGPKLAKKQSNVHVLDLLMRKRINILLNSEENKNKKFLAKAFNKKRIYILKQFQVMGNKSQSDLDLNKYVEMLG